MHTQSEVLLMRDCNNEDNGVGHPFYSDRWYIIGFEKYSESVSYDDCDCMLQRVGWWPMQQCL